MASNTIPFQPAYSLNPKYGFRYGPSTFVDTTTKVGGNPVGGLDLTSSGVPPLNNPTMTSGNSTMDGGDNDNGSAQASIDMSTQASLANNGKQADTDPNTIFPNLIGMAGMGAGIPFAGAAAGFGAVPRDGYTGSEGTIGPNGGMFNAEGREIDQITGQAYNSYGSTSQFYDGSYMSGIKDAKGFGNTFDAVLSDPDNAFSYKDPGSVMNEAGDRYGSKEEQFAKSKGLETNTPEFRQKVLLDKGIPASSLDGEHYNPSVAAMDINNYSPTNAAPAGSQYSMTGTFSSDSDNNNGNESNTGGGGSDDYGSMFNAGGLVPPPNMGKRAQDVPNPMMQDPLAGLL
jgi:hypothetical protein